jgi:hypothetical protein
MRFIENHPSTAIIVNASAKLPIVNAAVVAVVDMAFDAVERTAIYSMAC